MANGRLQSTTIPAYSAAEIYNNNSGSQASVTIHGQVISETDNSKLSVAATTCDYSTTIVTSSTCSSCTVGPYNCLLAVNYCDVAAETYNGYSMNTGSDICLSAYTPSYVTTAGAQVCKPYGITQECCYSFSPCCFASCLTNYGMQYTLVHPKILSKCGSGRFVAANYVFDSGTGNGCLIMSCVGCHSDEVNLKLSSNASTVAGCFTHASNGEIITCATYFPTQWYIDLWSSQTFGIGHQRAPTAPNLSGTCGCDHIFVLCACSRTASTLPGCVCRNDKCILSNQSPLCNWNVGVNYWICLPCFRDHYQKGPMNGGGCDVYYTHDQSYIYASGVCAFYMKSIANIKSGSPTDMNCCWGLISKTCVCCQYESGTCSCGRPVRVTLDPGDRSALYPIKWFAYNPIKKCHYFMIYNGGLDDGIYSVDHTTLATCAQGYLTAGEGGRWWDHTLSNGPFTKISTVPSAYTSFGGAGTMCYGRLYQADFCYYTIPVHNGTNWGIFSSQDLISWSNSRNDSTCCFVQLTGSQEATYVSSGGSGICKVSNNFDTCINTSGMIDYRVEANQYQQNGVVVSNGDRLYAKNTGSNPIAFNVWGYEG